jgi:hypothetical protein
MARKLLSLAIFFLIYINGKAQITITAGDVQTIFPVGAQYLSHADTVTKSINIGGTGSFGTIDFRSVQSNTIYLTTSEDVASSPYAADYPGATYAFKNNQNYNGGAAESWVYTSFSDAYYLYGTATTATISGMNTTIKLKFNPAQQFYKFPITYNTTFSQSTSQVIETSFTGFPIPPVSTTQAWSMVQTVDGYGSIITPDGKTLNCLRVKDEVTINTPQTGPITTIGYSFITKTGESVSITPATGQPNSGVVSVESISWSEGFGTSNPVETLNAPTNLNVISSAGKIDLSWSDNSNNEDGFTILRAEGSGDFIQLAQVKSNVTSYTDTNIQNGVLYHYKVKSYNALLASDFSNIADATGIVVDVKELSGIPVQFKLEQNYPNPFNPTTMISFSLPQNSNVVLKIYNILGNEITELVRGEYPAGIYSVNFDASGLASGIYFYTIRTNDFAESRKMLLMK